MLILRRHERRRHRDLGASLFFLLPMLVLFLVFRFIPTFASIGMSFTNYNLSGNWHFTGAHNYAQLAKDPTFVHSLVVTIVYSAIYVPMTLLMALGTALLVQAVIWGRRLFRAALFLPYVTSFVLAGVIWLWIYQYDGLINGLLAHIHVAPIGFLQDSKLVLPSLALVSAWKGFGYSMLILVAGLNAIPKSCLEAAVIDGASARQRLLRVRLPLLKPVLFFVLVVETIGAFQVFDTVYVMTGGGPVQGSYTLVYALFNQAFQFFNFGYAATLGVVLFVIILLVSLIQRFALDRLDR